MDHNPQRGFQSPNLRSITVWSESFHTIFCAVNVFPQAVPLICLPGVPELLHSAAPESLGQNLKMVLVASQVSPSPAWCPLSPFSLTRSVLSRFRPGSLGPGILHRAGLLTKAPGSPTHGCVKRRGYRSWPPSRSG